MSKYLKVDYVNLGLQFQNLKQEITNIIKTLVNNCAKKRVSS